MPKMSVASTSTSRMPLRARSVPRPVTERERPVYMDFEGDNSRRRTALQEDAIWTRIQENWLPRETQSRLSDGGYWRQSTRRGICGRSSDTAPLIQRPSILANAIVATGFNRYPDFDWIRVLDTEEYKKLYESILQESPNWCRDENVPTPKNS